MGILLFKSNCRDQNAREKINSDFPAHSLFLTVIELAAYMVQDGSLTWYRFRNTFQLT